VWEYRAAVERVIDGDTVELSIDLGFDVSITRSVRVAGVNCPEVRGGTPESRAAGDRAAAFTWAWLTDQGGVLDEWPLTVVTSKERSFARYVGDIRRGGVSLADALIAAGHGTAP